MQKRLSALLLTCILSGCQSPIETQPVSTELAAAEMPGYAVGDRFTWRQTEQEWAAEIVGIDDETIDWRSSTGATWTTAVNFALPASRWAGSSQHGDGSQAASDIEGDLFPLQVGRTQTMRVKGSSTRFPDGWDETRSCEVAGQERVTVPAGSYDTYKVVCRTEWRTYTWYYSPELGTPVIYHNRHKTRGGRPEYLVSVERAGTS